jgi:2-methylcitrate dehydratase
LTRVEIRPDERFSARYFHELRARVTIRTKGQSVFVNEQNGYEGGLTNSMSCKRTVEKFHSLTEVFADEELRSRLI